MDEQSERLTAGPTMAFSPAACITVSACFGLTMLVQRIDSSIETAKNNTSDAPEERWGLPQEGISPCPFFHGPELWAVCRKRAAGKVAGVWRSAGTALRPQIFCSNNSVTKW